MLQSILLILIRLKIPCHVNLYRRCMARMTTWHPMLCDCAVREMAARLLGIVTTALSVDSASSLLARLCDPGDRISKFEAREGNLAATGFMLAQLSTGAGSQAQAIPGSAA